jgi:hypothetical protein
MHYIKSLSLFQICFSTNRTMQLIKSAVSSKKCLNPRKVFRSSKNSSMNNATGGKNAL